MADKYGFTITTTDEASGKLQKIQVEINNTVSVAQKAGQEISRGLESAGHSAGFLESQFSHIGATIAGAFALHGIKEFASHILEVTQEFEGFDNRIKFSANSILDAGQNLNFLKTQVESLNLPAKNIYEGFSEMEMGLKGTGIEGKKLRDLFEGMSYAGAVGHVSDANLSRILYDFKEIGERGLMKRYFASLSGTLPNFGKIVKDAFGKGYEELVAEKMSGTKFLEVIGPAMKKNFEKGLDQWNESLQARQNQYKNSLTDLFLGIGAKLEPTFKSMFTGATESLKGITQFVKGIDLGNLYKWGKTLAEIALAFGVLKVATIGYNGALAIYNTLEEIAIYRTLALESGQVGLAATTTALTETFVGLEGALATIGAGAAVFGLIKLAEYFNDIQKNVEKAAEAIGNFNKTDEAAKSLQDRFKDVKLSYDSFTRDLQSKDSNIANDAKERASKFLGDLPTTIEDYKKSISELKTTQEEQLKELKNNPNVFSNATAGGSSIGDFGSDPTIGGGGEAFVTGYGKKLADKAEQTKKDLDENTKQLGELTKMLDAIKKLGIKGSAAGTENNNHTAADSIGVLSGANGGLDKAKIINIKVDTMQKIGQITGIDDYRKATTEAIDTMIRMFNNISNGSAATV